MSEAWNIVARSLSKGASNYWSFAKIWFMSLLILAVIFMVIFGVTMSGDTLKMLMVAGNAPEMMTPEMYSEFVSSMSSLGIWMFLFTIFYLIVLSGLSVNSLRYYAGNYTPSWVPFQFQWGTTFAFIGWSIVLVLIMIIIMIIPSILMSMLLSSYMSSGSGFMYFLAWLVYFAGIVIASWVMLRLFNKLVARANDTIITFGEAWDRTKGSFVFFLGLVLIILVVTWLFSMGISIVFGLLFSLFSSPTMLAIVGFFFTVAVIMISIYFYAVYYAICVEIYHKFFDSPKAA